MSTPSIPDEREQYRCWCRHFTGVMNPQGCKAGHHYKDIARPLPCVRVGDGAGFGVGCPSFSAYSEAEIDAEIARSHDVMTAFLRKLDDNICPACDAPVVGHKQVGRCVYAQPCGHRLYQGKARMPRKQGTR